MKQNVCTVGIDLAKKIFHYSKSSIDLVLRDAFRKMRHFLMTTQGVSEDKAVSLMSVGMGFRGDAGGGWPLEYPRHPEEKPVCGRRNSNKPTDTGPLDGSVS